MLASHTNERDGRPTKRTKSKSVDLRHWQGLENAGPIGIPLTKTVSADLNRLAHSVSILRSPTSPTFSQSHSPAPLAVQRHPLPTPEELVQERAFRKWLNARLEASGFEPMTNLATDIPGGVSLLCLLEVLSGESLGRWNRHPRLRVQRAENLHIALQWITSKGIRLENVSAEDLLDGNVKLILGLIWTLLFRLSFQSLAAEGHNARDVLLKWVQTQIAPYDLECFNWTYSFQDGVILCALVHSQRPSSLQWQQIDEMSDEERIELAFDVAHTVFKVPRSLEVHDLCKGLRSAKPDEKVVMTYVASLYEAFKATHIAETSAGRLAAFAEQIDAVLGGQEEYERRAAELLTALADIRHVWSQEATPQTFGGASRMLESMADSKCRDSLRRERSELSALYVRVTTLMATNDMAPWRLGSHLLPLAINADIERFFDEEDARRQTFADCIVRCQDDAKSALTQAATHCLRAMNQWASQVDAAQLDNLHEYIGSLETSQKSLPVLDSAIEQIKSAEDHCREVGVAALHAQLHTSHDMRRERDRMAESIDERLSFARTQLKLRAQKDDMSVADVRRARSAWRHVAEGFDDRLDHDQFAVLVALPEVALDWTPAEVDKTFTELARQDGAVSSDDFVHLLKDQRGEAGIKNALAARTAADGSFDASHLPAQTANTLERWIAKSSGVEGLLSRAYQSERH